MFFAKGKVRRFGEAGGHHRNIVKNQRLRDKKLVTAVNIRHISIQS